MSRHSDLLDLSRVLEDYTPPEEINLLDEGIDRYPISFDITCTHMKQRLCIESVTQI
jgi:hypothetical protein